MSYGEDNEGKGAKTIWSYISKSFLSSQQNNQKMKRKLTE
jgi:hypothetical protein